MVYASLGAPYMTGKTLVPPSMDSTEIVAPSMSFEKVVLHLHELSCYLK